MNVYEQIETIFSGDAEKKPEWANEILKELADIKTLLVKKELPHQRVNIHIQTLNPINHKNNLCERVKPKSIRWIC